jgi:uncharacterized RDD family membrane protein YckC
VESRADQIYWRQEIVTRVQQHRARRRRRFDADASLELNFPAQDTVAEEASPPATSENPTNQPVTRVDRDEVAVAGDRFSRSVAPLPAEPKIIRFPRIAPPETALTIRPFVDELELAEPSPEAPRILDAPEAQQLDLLYDFTDIQLEESAPGEDLDLPPQPAPLLQRALATFVDGVIVLAAAGVFAAAFVEMSGATLSRGRTASLGAAIVIAILWLLFQYIFLVYGRGTPGMLGAGLEVCNFAGERPSLFARRSRGLATLMSALSLGVGFVWALVDEDTLGWHDRISGTYMRSSRQHSGAHRHI